MIMATIICPDRPRQRRGLETNLDNEPAFYSHSSENGPLAMCFMCLIVKGECVQLMLRLLIKCARILIDLVNSALYN